MTPPESPDDQVLREWLAREAPAPLPDAGFTRRVLSALPPPRPKRDWRPTVILALGASAGLLWALHNGASLTGVVGSGIQATGWMSDNALIAAAAILGAWFLFDGEDGASSRAPADRSS